MTKTLSTSSNRIGLHWAYQVLLWILYWIYSAVQSLPFYNNLFQNLFTEGIFLISIIISVYTNLKFFIPQFLIPRKYSVYFLLAIGLSFGTAWLTNQLLAWSFHPIEIPFYSGWQGRLVLFTDILLIMALTSAMQFLWKWRERDRYARELEQKNIETELALLKSQVNPHFVFNILNTVYHLISRNAEKAQTLLLQFSDILSHQIYDSAKDRIPLEKEITYLKNYIEIEEMRSGEFMELSCKLPESVNGYEIAPMLMLPLFENAFKHSKRAEGYQVQIEMEVQDKSLILDIKNSISKNGEAKTNRHGIGLPNVKRRLELLYPNQHSFSAKETEEDCFHTHLTLKLHEA